MHSILHGFFSSFHKLGPSFWTSFLPMSSVKSKHNFEIQEYSREAGGSLVLYNVLCTLLQFLFPHFTQNDSFLLFQNTFSCSIESHFQTTTFLTSMQTML